MSIQTGKEGPAILTFLIDKDVAQCLESSSRLVHGRLTAVRPVSQAGSAAWWIRAGAGRPLAPSLPLPLNQLDDTERGTSPP